MSAPSTVKRPESHDTVNLLFAAPEHLWTDLLTLPEGQRRVACALLTGKPVRTYPDVARRLGIHLGTVHTHLRRIRRDRPEVYAAVMRERQNQLAERHAAAATRALQHSREWFRRKANRRYRERFGCWPWERNR